MAEKSTSNAMSISKIETIMEGGDCLPYSRRCRGARRGGDIVDLTECLKVESNFELRGPTVFLLPLRRYCLVSLLYDFGPNR